jgi:hypothetical protein
MPLALTRDGGDGDGVVRRGADEGRRRRPGRRRGAGAELGDGEVVCARLSDGEKKGELGGKSPRG